MMRSSLSVILSAIMGVCAKMNEGYSINTLLPNSLSLLSDEDYSLGQAILYESIRQTARNRFILSKFATNRPTPLVQALLECSFSAFRLGGLKDFVIVNETVNAAKMRPETQAAVSFVNALLRRYVRERDSLEELMAQREDCLFNAPIWWVRAIKHAQPTKWKKILGLAQRHPPLTLRVNTSLSSVPELMARLAEAEIPARQVGQEAIEIISPVPVVRIPGFREGLCSVQDAGAQLVADFLPLKDGDRVLDACAAPGGKTAHLLERHKVELTALEIDPVRTQRIHENLDRLGLQANVITANAGDTASWWDHKPFDAILLDAPCTASGVTRRQPDTPWLRRPSDIEHLAREQKSLLGTLWPLLKDEGHLLYVTCSIFPEEGTLQIQNFLKAHSDAKLVPLCTSNQGMMLLVPHEEEYYYDGQLPSVHDGFFYALLKKEATSN